MTNAGNYEEVRLKLRRSSGQYCEIVSWLEENLEGNSLSAVISWIFILLNLSWELRLTAVNITKIEDKGKERDEGTGVIYAWSRNLEVQR